MTLWNTFIDVSREVRNPNPRKLELCDQAAAWVNLNAFAARITGKGLVRWTWFGIIALTNGLEDKPPRVPSPWAPDAAAAVAERYRVVYEMHVQAASQWILLGGTAIFSDAFRGDCYDGERGHQITRPGKLYKKRGGRPGLDMTRWRFWRQRFEELGGGGGKARTSDKVRAEALQAARRMDEIVARRLGTNDADGTV
ncbi:hypothetical protein F503_08346 [Ophiostoma piceae UAMH 11346]|uniref:Uncharacterized protein n=1 Tax=Ophiostoma piceae (strain UAMH 11346) TaxID=1262450 RepID=S3CY54_OPHP1|nr:hypothetical protein F503_08346 [Ophiostoma piceae UAMH 11346]